MNSITTPGQQLKKTREAKKITQSVISDDLHISRATIIAAENGGNVGIKTIEQMSEYLGYKLKLVELSKFPTFEELKNEQ